MPLSLGVLFLLAAWCILMCTLYQSLCPLCSFWLECSYTRASYNWLTFNNHSGFCLNATSFYSSYSSLTPTHVTIMRSHAIFFKEFGFWNVLVCLFYNIFIFNLPCGQRLHSFVHCCTPVQKNPAWSAMTFNICWLISSILNFISWIFSI